MEFDQIQERVPEVIFGENACLAILFFIMLFSFIIVTGANVY